jgi:hypothetical protein
LPIVGDANMRNAYRPKIFLMLNAAKSQSRSFSHRI